MAPISHFKPGLKHTPLSIGPKNHLPKVGPLCCPIQDWSMRWSVCVLLDLLVDIYLPYCRSVWYDNGLDGSSGYGLKT